MRGCSARVFVMLLSVAAAAASADPGALTLAGGTIELLDEHPAVRLVKERLILEPDAVLSRVTAVLDFVNEGAATDVQMGFPVFPDGGPGGYHFVDDFVVEADRQPLSFERVAREIVLGTERETADWYLFSVRFQEAGRHRLVVTYVEKRSAQYDGAVPYVLYTGATWKGTLRKLDVEVRMDDRRNFRSVILTGDGEVLPVEMRGQSLFWHCEDYHGDPEVLRLTYIPGLAQATIDRFPYHCLGDLRYLRWHDGELWAEAEYLCGEVMCSIIAQDNATITLLKEGQELTVPVRTFAEEEGPGPPFVPVQAVCETFGGTLEVTENPHGGPSIAITTPVATIEGLRATALFCGEVRAYRLECLRRLATESPDECDAVCRTLLRRQAEEPAVVLWAVGRLFDVHGAAAVRQGTRALPPGDRSPEALADIIVATKHDLVTRGGGLLLRELDPDGAVEALFRQLSGVEGQDDADPEGVARAVGLALRIVESPLAFGALRRAALTHPSRQVREAALEALGYLGDSASVPLLVSVAKDNGKHEDERARAAAGLARSGIAEAIPALADLAVNVEWPGVSQWALAGLQWLVGMVTSHPPLPEWARAVPAEEAQRLVWPYLEGIEAGPNGPNASGTTNWIRKRLAELPG